MKAVLLDGSLFAQPEMKKLGDTIEDLLTSVGWSVERIVLRDTKVAYCLGCFECWIKSPGLCRIDDAGRDVAGDVINSDLAIFLTPVTFGGYSSQLKKVVDRLICLILPFFKRIDGEVHHKARYEHYPSLLGVGLLPASDPVQEAIFHELIARNSINLHAPRHASHIALGAVDDQSLQTFVLENVSSLVNAPAFEKAEVRS